MAGLRVQVRSGGKSGARSAGVRVDGALGRAGAVAPGDGRPDATGPGKRLCASAAGAGQRGFSLIEIILVVVLIGGIVAFAATRILGGGDRARVRLAEAQVQTLAEKVQQFEMDTGSLPATLEQLVVEPGGAVGWLGPYARPSELRDPWNTPFEYRVPGDGRPFDIVSYGADRKPGGTSVDADIRYE
ncbi:MAG: type II secretion system major pseudopilin GspG [Xanthomonadaceae bacterium]|jgi:general secretion pathway protein G|nr:type II secretion system major pseudopilin GspG [Xanthomonadaceae bacterium]